MSNLWHFLAQWCKFHRWWREHQVWDEPVYRNWKNTLLENTASVRFLVPKGAGDPCFVFLSVKSDWQLSSNPAKDLQLLIFCRGNTQEQKQLGVTARDLFLSLNVSREKEKKNSLIFFLSLPSTNCFVPVDFLLNSQCPADFSSKTTDVYWIYWN